MNESSFESSFFHLSRRGDVCIATMTKNQLTEDENLEQWMQDLIRIVETLNCLHIICDLKSVRYVTSGAIGKLIALHRRLVREDGKLVICQLQPTVSDILATSHLLQYFDVSEDVDSAVARFQ